jgi:hypothetical protein
MKSKLHFIFKTFLLLFAICNLQYIFAQAPQKMSYQAVIRNASGVLVTSTSVGIRISILQNSSSGTSVYTETQTTSTNANGLVSLEIGTGTVVSGTFSAINWAVGTYFIKTETDPAGGSSYTIVGVNQLMSVPYALFAASGNVGATGATGPPGLPGTNGTFPAGNAIGDMQYWNGTSWVLIPIGAPGQSLKVTPSNIPQWSTASALSTVVSNSITSINAQDATFNGTVTSAGGELVLSRGFCYNTSPSPTVANNLEISGAGLGTFTGVLSGLTANTTYYARAFSTSIAGTTYGADITFTTQSGIVSLTTNLLNTITACSASTVSVTIISDGGSLVGNSGIVYNTSLNPTIANNVFYTFMGGTITGLTANTTYYYRAFASNAVGIYYGAEYSFTTASGTATLSTSIPTLVTACSASIAGIVTANGGETLTNSGICWATTANPTTANSFVNYDPNYPQNDILTNFNPSLMGLLPNTIYYARAFTTNCAGTTYGNQVSFTTATGIIALTTSTVSNLSGCSATFTANISSDGGSALTTSGLCYSVSINPTIANTIMAFVLYYDPNINNVTKTLTGLLPNTTYYIRSYATNCAGTTYGNQVSFTTLDGVITLTTGSFPSIYGACSTGSYSGNNIVTNNSVSSVINNKICYSTSPNPTIANSISTSSSLSGLLPNTTYYYKGFETSCNGTTYYGNELSFTTAQKVNSILTSPVTGANNTASGFCYSTNPTPTVLDNLIYGDTYAYFYPSSTYSISIQNLIANTTYYVRAFVQDYNSSSCIGTVYGNQVSFTTNASGFVIGQNYGGGIISYIDMSGIHGLIAATTDQGLAQWGCQGTTTGATGTAQGDGLTNTASILSNCGTIGIAAEICDNLTLNSFSDWYLPSRDELFAISALNFFPVGNYWSSTETSANQAVSVNNLTATSTNKSFGSFKVRAVRSF